MRVRSGARRRGFILPLTLLVTTVITVLLAASFILVSAEFRVTDSSFASSRALAYAQAGLQDYFAQPRSLGTGYDSTTIAYSGGYATVVAYRLRAQTAVVPAVGVIWVVKSIGTDTVRASSGQPNARRAIMQLARFQSASVPARAALVAANGVHLYGAGSLNYALSGVDLGAQCSCVYTKDSTAFSVPAGLWQSDATAITPTPNEQPASAPALLALIGIDWTRLLQGYFTPDRYIAAGSTSGWPASGSCSYQSWYVQGTATMPNSSGMRGMLVVTGDLVINNNAHWDGVILVGGRLLPQAWNTSYVLHGMVVTGLNLLSSPLVPVGTDSLWKLAGWNQGSRPAIQWDYCYASGAVATQSYLVPLNNAWFNNWPTY